MEISITVQRTLGTHAPIMNVRAVNKNGYSIDMGFLADGRVDTRLKSKRGTPYKYHDSRAGDLAMRKLDSAIMGALDRYLGLFNRSVQAGLARGTLGMVRVLATETVCV